MQVMRAVLFDYGWTLVSFTYPRTALLDAMEEARYWLGPNPPPAAWILDHVLLPLEHGLTQMEEAGQDYMEYYRAAWRQAGFSPSEDVLWRIVDLEQSVWDRSVVVAEDALAVLDQLRARGLRLAIASNAPFPPRLLHRQLRLNGFSERVDVAVFSGEIGQRKPAAAFFEAVLDRVGVAAEESLYVGDRFQEDYEGPIRVGLRALLCTQLASQLPPPGIPSIARLADLPAALESCP
ncbi:MAG: HAD family hydrolase [Candidatus Dormibacteraceae bacterium]